MPVNLLVTAAILVCATDIGAQAFHQRSPNNYKRTVARNDATKLNDRLIAGEIELVAEDGSARGRLRGLLAALKVPESSQTLVFSKTSLQRHRVSPKNPRALYFNDDIYIGWIPGAASLEVIVGDEELGLAFYTMPQDPSVPARLIRDDSCLSCHAGSRTFEEPGLLLRSVFPDEDGEPIAGAGETDMNFRSPIAERWGGWIVTGQIEAPHRGNDVAYRSGDGLWRVDSRPAKDLNTFASDFPADRYLRATSDIGALLVLEQQAAIHSLLVRAMHQVRYLENKDRILAGMLDSKDARGGTSDSTQRIIDELAVKITRAILLDGEVSLREHDVVSDAEFARDYAAMWPASLDGRQLGQVDLIDGLFTLPMSPMIQSRAFLRLPDVLRHRVLARLQVAVERGVPPGNVRIDLKTRRLLESHLRETTVDWPAPRHAK
jgi:hypothetical protein